MAFHGRSLFHVSNLAFRQVGVVPEAQQLLFASWGHNIHQERGLIVETIVRHLLGAQNLTKIIEDPVCGEIFVLCSSGQQVSILSRYNVDVDRDVNLHFASLPLTLGDTCTHRVP
jgi:hypothetical protein